MNNYVNVLNDAELTANTANIMLFVFHQNFKKMEGGKKSGSEQPLWKGHILELKVMTEPPTVGGMNVWTRQKYTVTSA